MKEWRVTGASITLLEHSLRIGAFTRYASRGASSRLRFIQYFPECESQGFSIQHEPLFADHYIQSLQTGTTRYYTVIKELVRRIHSLRATSQFDVIWVEKDALPWVPALLEMSLLPRNVPLVIDYDDAVFHHYDMSPHFACRLLFGKKHQVLMRNSALVLAGNEYIADYAWRAGAHRVEILPTVVDLNRYRPSCTQSYKTINAVPTVGWIGQRSTADYLFPLAPLFARLGKTGIMQFRAIGINALSLNLPMSSEVWSEQTEVASIQKLDIGVMPLNDGPFERGKCGYKLIQYMACGLPVVASPVGVNTMIVEHGVNGFLVNSLDEWEWALKTLANDPNLRYRMGQAGRAKVERQYCLEVTSRVLASFLFEAASFKRG